MFCIENNPSAPSSPYPIKILEIENLINPTARKRQNNAELEKKCCRISPPKVNYANHVGCELATCRTTTSDRMSQCYDGVRSGWGDIVKIHTCQILNVRGKPSSATSLLQGGQSAFCLWR